MTSRRLALAALLVPLVAGAQERAPGPAPAIRPGAFVRVRLASDSLLRDAERGRLARVRWSTPDSLRLDWDRAFGASTTGWATVTWLDTLVREESRTPNRVRGAIVGGAGMLLLSFWFASYVECTECAGRVLGAIGGTTLVGALAGAHAGGLVPGRRTWVNVIPGAR